MGDIEGGRSINCFSSTAEANLPDGIQKGDIVLLRQIRVCPSTLRLPRGINIVSLVWIYRLESILAAFSFWRPLSNVGSGPSLTCSTFVGRRVIPLNILHDSNPVQKRSSIAYD